MGKNKIIPLLVIVGIVAFLGYLGWNKKPITLLSGADQRNVCNATASASTTRTHLQYGSATYASTTLTVSTADRQQVEITEVANVASSTAVNYDVLLQTSSDGINFYPISYPMAYGTDHGTTTINVPNTDVYYRWIPGTTSTTSRAFKINPIMGNYTRFIFSAGTSTDVTSRGAIWAQVCVK